MKFLVKLFFFAVILGIGYFLYGLWEKGELNREGLEKSYLEHKEKGLQRSLMDIRDEIVVLSGSARDQWKSIDWKGVRNTLNLSEDDLEKYKKSAEWLYEESDKVSSPAEEEKSTSVVSSGSEEEPIESPKVAVEPKRVAVETKRVAMRSKKEFSRGEQPVKKKTPDEGSRHYHAGMKVLQEAKEESKLGLPGKKNFKTHLKKSIELYRSSLDKFRLAQKDSKCTAKQKHHIEDLESKVSGQIYWATKFGSI
jgi:hypothetical protein